jgi:hypothetical protein
MKAAALILFALSSIAFAVPATPQSSKLWATDLPAFMNEQPGGHWIVARNEKPALSAAEAEQFARRDAARAILPIVREKLAGPVDSEKLTRVIEATIDQDNWIVDRQIDRNDRPYATIWNAALLVDASPRNVNLLARQLNHVIQVKRSRLVACVFAFMVLSAIVGCAYIFLNWLTRGFFRARLALASILVIALGVAGMVHLL